MSDTNVAPGGGEGTPAPVIVSTPAAETPAVISASEAGRALSARRAEIRKASQAAPVAAPPEPAAVEPPQQLADEANAAPETEPGETREAEPAEQPPIEPPRSWTKEEKEEFATYPREAQEKIARAATRYEADFRRSQNEAAEKLKGLTAKEQAVEQARQQWDSKLPALLQALQDQQAGAFSDIKSMADVQKLASDDPFRYLQWQAHQQNVAAVQSELTQAEQRKAQEYQSRWADFAQREDQAFADKAPELADPAQKAKMQEAALGVLKDVGFSEPDLAAMWNGQASLSLRDHRVQLLIRDGIKYREAQAAKKVVTAKPLPPVQRPGVAPAKNAASIANLENLSRKAEQTGDPRDVAALVTARRAAR